MESTSPPPVKKIRSMNDIKLIECRREFKLPVQFPSMATLIKTKGVCKTKNGTNTTNNLETSKNLKDSTVKDTPITNNVKKLRIKSQDGKDLGEIKVKFLSQELSTPLNSKIITLTRSGVISNLTNGTNTPVNEAQETISPNKVFPQVFPSINDKRSDTESANKKLITHKPLILTKPLNNIRQSDNIHIKKGMVVSKKGHTTMRNIQSLNDGPSKFVKIQKSKCSTLICTQNNGTIRIKKKSELNNIEKPILVDSAPEIITKTSISNVDKPPELKEYWQLAKSKFPVVKCEKLTISKNKMNINELSYLSTKIDKSKPNFSSIGMNNKVVEEISRGNNISYNTKKGNNTVDNEKNNQEKSINLEIQKTFNTNVGNNDITASNDRSTFITKDHSNTQSEDCTSMSSISKNVHSESQNVFSNVNNRPISCLGEKTYNNKNEQKKDPNFENNISDTNNIKDTTNNAFEQERLSQHWYIIKEALTSVKDEELRTKALQALADCGIGIAKHVPITLPEKLKTVHDSLVQTDVFGLLDLESFVLVKENTPALERIKQTERSTFDSVVHLNIPKESNIKQNNYIDNDYLLPSLSLIPPVDDINDINNYFDQFFTENKDTRKVKQILATPYSLYKKVALQLQKDFQEVQEWDNNGLLNIHRAVIDNNLRKVQRLLLVLKGSKISVDVLTADYMVNLYFCIKCNIMEL